MLIRTRVRIILIITVSTIPDFRLLCGCVFDRFLVSHCCRSISLSKDKVSAQRLKPSHRHDVQEACVAGIFQSCSHQFA